MQRRVGQHDPYLIGVRRNFRKLFLARSQYDGARGRSGRPHGLDRAPAAAVEAKRQEGLAGLAELMQGQADARGATTASRRRAPRMLASMWRQGTRSLVCPETPRLEGQRALVTGGSEGVGLGTCRGLLQRGARVIMASRSAAKGERACAQLRDELKSLQKTD